MSILAANSQNNRSSSNPYMTADFNSGNEKVGHFDCTSIMSTLNEIDDKNIRVMFKQAKDRRGTLNMTGILTSALPI